MNRIERRVRNLVNPYSTAFAGWWCHSGRYLTLVRIITGTKAAARPPWPGPAMPRAKHDGRLAIQASRRAAVDEPLKRAAAEDEQGVRPPGRRR